MMVVLTFLENVLSMRSEGIKQDFSPKLNVKDERFLTKVDFNNCSFGRQADSWIKSVREVYKEHFYKEIIEIY